MDVFHEVKSIVAKYGHVDPDDITLDSTVDSLGLDSLSVIDIGDQEQIDSFTSVKDMVDFMEQDS